MRSHYLFFLALAFIANTAKAQVDDNTSVYKNVSSDRYFRIHYDNDFFTNADYYYTQGISLEYVSPGLRKNPMNKLLLKPKTTALKYGVALNYLGFTPTIIDSDDILYGDRPFASHLSLKSFVIATDTVRKYRLSSSLSVGFIGPAAGGKEVQTGIHRALGNIIPKGWQYQVRNDAIVNYQVDLEKQLFALKNNVLLSGEGSARIGTLQTKASAGLSLMAGNFTNPYGAAAKNKNISKGFRYFIFLKPQINVIGYDATLQGGIFNKSTPYTIANSDIQRATFQFNYGAVITFGNVTLEYAQTYLTKEFATGKFHKWGGFKVGVRF